MREDVTRPPGSHRAKAATSLCLCHGRMQGSISFLSFLSSLVISFLFSLAIFFLVFSILFIAYINLPPTHSRPGRSMLHTSPS